MQCQGITLNVWIYENEVKNQAFFFSPENIAKVKDIAIKRNLPWLFYLPLVFSDRLE